MEWLRIVFCSLTLEAKKSSMNDPAFHTLVPLHTVTGIFLSLFCVGLPIA